MNVLRNYLAPLLVSLAIIAGVVAFAPTKLDPCPVKQPSAVYPPLPAPFPGDLGDCWEAYQSAVATATANYWSCMNSISPTAPNVCHLRKKCEDLYKAYTQGAEEGYYECVFETRSPD